MNIPTDEQFLEITAIANKNIFYPGIAFHEIKKYCKDNDIDPEIYKSIVLHLGKRWKLK